MPPGTHTPNKPLEARAAFRRGNHLRAFRTLRSHVDELLTTENTQASGIDFIEFVNMMTKVDRLPEASLVLAHLEATGLLDSQAWRSLVTESATAIAAAADPDRSGARALSDDRAALEYVRQGLDDLVGGRERSCRPSSMPRPPPADSGAGVVRQTIMTRQAMASGVPFALVSARACSGSPHRRTA